MTGTARPVPARPLNSSIDDALFQVAAELADVVYLIRLEPDPQFEFVSESVEDVIGYSADEHYADPDLMRRVVDPADAHILSELMRIPRGAGESFFGPLAASRRQCRPHAPSRPQTARRRWFAVGRGAVTELTEASRSRDAVIEARIEAGEMLRAVMDSMLDPTWCSALFATTRAASSTWCTSTPTRSPAPTSDPPRRSHRQAVVLTVLGRVRFLLMTWAAQALGRGPPSAWTGWSWNRR